MPDNDLDLSLLLMGLLNVITITFLTAVIVLTQYRIAFSQKAAGFMDELMVMPERPEIRIAVVGGCCILLGMCIWLKEKIPFRERRGFLFSMLWKSFWRFS